MRFLNKIFIGKYKFIWLCFSGLILLYILFRLFLFNTDAIVPFFSSLNDKYLLVAEGLASKILHFFGSDIIVQNHHVLNNSVLLEGFKIEIRLKKWMLLFLFLIFITRTSFIKRVLYAAVLLVVHFFIIVVYTACGAYISGSETPDFSYLSIPVTIGLLILITIMFSFFSKNKDAVFRTLERLKINTSLFDNGYAVYFTICFLIILTNFLFVFFDYLPWINFLFNSARRILALMGYEAVVKPFVLEGSQCSITMIKGCLGFQTMLLFAVLVLITGHKNKYRWVYVIGGVIFLNVVNIFRFVFLFIHLYKHGDYTMAMELHDMYNLITYSFVFILWVIWFEKFADTSGA